MSSAFLRLRVVARFFLRLRASFFFHLLSAVLFQKYERVDRQSVRDFCRLQIFLLSAFHPFCSLSVCAMQADFVAYALMIFGIMNALGSTLGGLLYSRIGPNNMLVAGSYLR